MMTRTMHRRPSAVVLGASLVALLALPLLAISPAAARCGLSHYHSKPKEIVVVGATSAASSGLQWSGRRTISDVTMKRGVIGVGNHPNMLWYPTPVGGPLPMTAR